MKKLKKVLQNARKYDMMMTEPKSGLHLGASETENTTDSNICLYVAHFWLEKPQDMSYNKVNK